MDPRVERAGRSAFAPYQCFRKGGSTGQAPCGAIQAGITVLGQCTNPVATVAAVAALVAQVAIRHRAHIAVHSPGQLTCPPSALTLGPLCRKTPS